MARPRNDQPGQASRHRPHARIALVAAALSAALPHDAAPAQRPPATAPPEACVPRQDLRFICGLHSPEDLVRVPGTRWIVASRMAHPLKPLLGTGGLTLIDTAARTASVVRWMVARPRAPYTGCATGPEPARFSTHGLAIRAVGRRRSRLFVVGHHGREAIEVFDITSGAGTPTVTWIGCIRVPAGRWNNAVAALPDGRLIVTDFVDSPTTIWDVIAGRVTGAVYMWSPGRGFSKLPGTELSGPNGVEVSPDGRYLFVAVSGASSVLRYALADTRVPPAVVRPGFRTDNLRWGPGGRLLLAGPRFRPDYGPGQDPPAESLAVAAVDPTTLAVSPVAEFPVSPGFTKLSSALIFDDVLWVGAPPPIDRVAYVRLMQGSKADGTIVR